MEIAEDEKIYQGKDMRAFNKLIVKGEISKLYKDIFKEMEKGFNCIETTEENKSKVKDIVKFLNMHPFVEVKVKENKKNNNNKHKNKYHKHHKPKQGNKNGKGENRSN